MPSEARMKSELDVLKAMVPQSCKEIISLTESWLERKVVSEEEILEIVKGATIKWDCAVPSENWGYEKSVAHAIAEYVNGGPDERQP